MSRSFEQAAAEARLRRSALTKTIGDVRQRLTLPQLVEDTVQALDPQLSWLGRLKERVHNNRLLSLAVLAGVGWLAGVPRHLKNGEPPASGESKPATPQANIKEKKNDSGHQRDHGPVPGAGQRQQGPRAEVLPRAEILRRQRKARPDRGIAPDERQPQQQQRAGQRIEPQQQVAPQRRERQQQPEREQPEQRQPQLRGERKRVRPGPRSPVEPV